MKRKVNRIDRLLFAFPLLLLFSSVNAQKLPAIQTKSVRAPANVKVDGKAFEWGDQLQAYNKSTNIFYTIANDDEKLYLIIRATDKRIIGKIINGGVTLTINGTGKMKDIGGSSITFPAYQKEDPMFYFGLREALELGEKNNSQIDSFMNSRNTVLSSNLKIIGISGISEVKDSIVSVYNEEEIRATGKLDRELTYIGEMAIPLKYLQVEGKQAGKFVYNIKLNGTTATGTNVQTHFAGRDIIMYTGRDGIRYYLGSSTPENIAIALPTDFWGEYILVR